MGPVKKFKSPHSSCALPTVLLRTCLSYYEILLRAKSIAVEYRQRKERISLFLMENNENCFRNMPNVRILL